ncbi:DUF5949 family protein [Streptomyces lomondensis]|uniref:Uncharacterized protein n=1 Tax=Streptomyces lomondensis TaxID=68229 RepID=A0ABQ2XQB5_9ACTN|nr:DUF5949 family protein [Streptomyces lomondensis]MCF0080806.1 DUF5949 family protein [Streptomyces lomondensis]GGX29016.1 hypothetical protein GCM10010383_69490 [Streptomyces lomondensis]
MTSISPETQSVHTDDLVSLVLLSWRGTTPDGDVPYLLACSLGDGANGPEATAKAIEQLLAGVGLPVGEGLVHATQRPSLPVSLLVVPGSAVLTVRHLKWQFVPPETWMKAVAELGYVYLIFATRPWPEGAEPGDLETLAAFTSDEDVLTSAAHVVLPARSLRG